MPHKPTDADDGELPELFSPAEWRKLTEHLDLPTRQRDVAWLVCRGLGNKSIAARLGISANTVRMHLQRVFDRLNVRDRVGVVVRLVHVDRLMNRKRGRRRANEPD